MKLKARRGPDDLREVDLTIDALGKLIASGLDGVFAKLHAEEWKKYSMKLEFVAKTDGDTVSIANLTLSEMANVEKPANIKKAGKRVEGSTDGAAIVDFLEGLKKL